MGTLSGDDAGDGEVGHGIEIRPGEGMGGPFPADSFQRSSTGTQWHGDADREAFFLMARDRNRRPWVQGNADVNLTRNVELSGAELLLIETALSVFGVWRRGELPTVDYPEDVVQWTQRAIDEVSRALWAQTER